MIIKVGDQIIDTRIQPFALAFGSKEEANIVGNIIANIAKGNSESPNEFIWFMRHPSEMSEKDVDEWANLTDEQKLTDRPIKGDLKYIL